MKLQVAIDRVSLEQAINLAHSLDGIADIIELGTSLVKDYGLYAIKDAEVNLKKSQLLLDIKTNDECEYEFNQGFDAGADILTVMGSSSEKTVRIACHTAKQRKKTALIDLMGVNNNAIKKIACYPKAIYNLHYSDDAGKASNIIATTAIFHRKYPQVEKIAVAGGIDLRQATELTKQKIVKVVIVGGNIVKAKNPVKTAIKFKEAIKL